jgi:hypothetical protein
LGDWSRRLQIALAYEDQDDASALRRDPLWKSACDRLPEDDDLSSQPTLSRFEHAASARTVVDTQRAFEDQYVASLPAHTTCVVLDIDATDDPAHGQQQLACSYAHYDAKIQRKDQTPIRQPRCCRSRGDGGRAARVWTTASARRSGARVVPDGRRVVTFCVPSPSPKGTARKVMRSASQGSTTCGPLASLGLRFEWIGRPRCPAVNSGPVALAKALGGGKDLRPRLEQLAELPEQ